MKLLKKAIPLCLLTLVLAISVTLLTPKAQAATDGTCGDNLTWTLDNRGTLTISGDINRDGIISNDDVILLMWHIVFPEQFPI